MAYDMVVMRTNPALAESMRRLEDAFLNCKEEMEKKWQELEKLPLRENKRVPLTALLNQGRGERRGTPSDSHEALEKEVGGHGCPLEASSPHQRP